MNKRVLAISNQSNLLGGGEHSFIDLLTGLPKSWQTIATVPGKGEVQSKLNKCGVTTYAIPLHSLRPRLVKYVISTLVAYKKLCNQMKPDLIYANGTRAALYAGVLGFFNKIPVIWHCRVADSDGLVDLLLCKLCQKIIVNSNATARRFNRKFKRKIHIIYNGLNIDYLANNILPKPQLIQTDWKVVLTVARLSKWKRHDVVISAFEKVAKIDPNIHLICIGGKDPHDREWCDTLVQRAAQSKFSNRIHWIGKVDDVRPWYQSAWISVLVSENEPFGRVIVESLACGLPVVATNSGGIPEIVRSGFDGILVEPGNVEDTAAAIIKLLRDDNVRSNFAESGKDRANLFNLDSHIRKMVQVFDSAIKPSSMI